MFSLQVWLCGGTVEIIPCSVVAHLFRVTPWNLNGTSTAKNKLRVADVWMDEYKDVVFHTQKNIPVNRLKCKSQLRLSVFRLLKCFRSLSIK